MPVYGTAYSGSNVTSLGPGEALKLFDGTETAAAGLASIPFTPVTGINPNRTYTVTGAPTSGCSVAIQNSNDGTNWGTFASLTPDSTGYASYTDSGTANFYRVTLATYSSGPMPVVIVKEA